MAASRPSVTRPIPPIPAKPFDLIQRSILMMDPIVYQAKRYIDVTKRLGNPTKDNLEQFYTELIKDATFDQSTAIKWMRDHETNLKMSLAVVANKERDHYTCFVDKTPLFDIDIDTHLGDDDIMLSATIFRCFYQPDQSEFLIVGYDYISIILGSTHYFASVNINNDVTLSIKNMDEEQIRLNKDHPDGFKILDTIQLRRLSFNDIAKHFQTIVPYHRLSEKVLIRDLYYGIVRMWGVVTPSPRR